jgi:RNA polymerase sigma-70 factor (ECF subfamily)
VYLKADESDAELVRRCLRGEPEAYAPLVERYQKVLYNVTYRMVHDAEDARDLVQGALVKAYERLEDYDPTYRFFSWIYRILINDTLNLLKRRRPHQTLEGQGERVPAPQAGPQADLEKRELERSVRSALMTLSDEYRVVVVLKYFAELSYGEMSAALSIPEKTVKSRLYTARQRLAEILDGRRPR